MFLFCSWSAVHTTSRGGGATDHTFIDIAVVHHHLTTSSSQLLSRGHFRTDSSSSQSTTTSIVGPWFSAVFHYLYAHKMQIHAAAFSFDTSLTLFANSNSTYLLRSEGVTALVNHSSSNFSELATCPIRYLFQLTWLLSLLGTSTTTTSAL